MFVLLDICAIELIGVIYVYMAEGSGNILGDLYKNFPVFTIVSCVVVVYMLWYVSGGVERGEERRATGRDGIFIEVTGVGDSFDQQELFGVTPGETIQQALSQE